MRLEPAQPLFTPEELDQNEIRKRHMIKLFASEETVLVIGSGCSARLEYPTWPTLLTKLAALAEEVANAYGAEFHPDDAQAREDPLRYAGLIKAFIQGCDGKLDRYYNLLFGEFEER